MKAEAENNMIPVVKNELYAASESVENINVQNICAENKSAQNNSTENISVENFTRQNSSAESTIVQNLSSEHLLDNTENGTFKRI